MLKVLLPTDFSPSSYNAVVYALNLFKGFDVEFDLYHVVFYDGENGNDRDLKDHYENAQRQTDHLITELKKDHNNILANFSTHFDHGIRISQIINDYALHHKKDMVVMGARGERDSDDLLLGGRTNELIAASNIPVLSIPKNTSFKTIRNIMYATDLTDVDFEAKELIAFAKLFHSSVHFVHVFPELLGTTRFNPDHITSDLSKKFKYPNITFDAIMNNNVEAGLIGFMEEKKPEIVALFTHKRMLLERLFTKSTTKKLAFQVSIPLFAFKKNPVLE